MAGIGNWDGELAAMSTMTSSTTGSGVVTERALSSENISGWGGEGLRAELARRAGLDEDRASALVLAAGEATSNSVEHGGGRGTLLLWPRPAALTIEVHDSGDLANPHQGLRRPELTGIRGRGLWMARQLCDHVHVWADSAGTHVRQSVYRASAQRLNSAAYPLDA